MFIPGLRGLIHHLGYNDARVRTFQATVTNDMTAKAIRTLVASRSTSTAQETTRSTNAQNLRSLIAEWNRILAVIPEEKEESLAPHIWEKIQKRSRARAEKNFTLADKLRDELLNEGIILEDTPDGVRWKKK